MGWYTTRMTTNVAKTMSKRHIDISMVPAQRQGNQVIHRPIFSCYSSSTNMADPPIAFSQDMEVDYFSSLRALFSRAPQFVMRLDSWLVSQVVLLSALPALRSYFFKIVFSISLAGSLLSFPDLCVIFGSSLFGRLRNLIFIRKVIGFFAASYSHFLFGGSCISSLFFKTWVLCSPVGCSQPLVLSSLLGCHEQEVY